MPSIFEDQIHETSVQGDSRGERRGTHVPTAILNTLSPAARATAMQFDDLLSVLPADLGRISDEIRSHPGLESLVLKLLASLALSPEDSVRTIEEATIVLGVDRLRALVSIWLLVREKTSDTEFAAKAENADPWRTENDSSHGIESEWTAEAIYVASLMRWLDVDSSQAGLMHEAVARQDPRGRKGESVGSADLATGDLISLMPFLDPTLLSSIRRLTLAGRRGSGEVACAKSHA